MANPNTVLVASARRLGYHERMALMLVEQGRGNVPGLGVGPKSIAKLLAAGLVVATDAGFQLSGQGVRLHRVLQELGWLPPRLD